MRNPWKMAREDFAGYWPHMSLRMKAHAIQLAAGLLFWTAVSDWSKRVQTKLMHIGENGGGPNDA